MNAILAIDAAWTEREPSGVALVSGSNTIWRCDALAPSYEAFIRLSNGQPVDWSARHFPGSRPDAAALLAAARRLLPEGTEVKLVPVDIPVATVPIPSRRIADQQISIHFGGRGCSPHSPDLTRPGPIGVKISQDFTAAGFPLATVGADLPTGKHLVEVYPHPALLTLLSANYRVPYKEGKRRKYWPQDTPDVRKVKLLTQFADILAALRQQIHNIQLPLPAPNSNPKSTLLKRFEDALDALVCAWVGIRCLTGNVTSFGDATAAIWVP
jgi:predicted RNase H-like nuclease